MKRRSANCMLVDLTSFLPVRKRWWIVCLQRWVRCIVDCLASRVGELRHPGTLHVQSEKHYITVFTPHVWSQQNYITVSTLHVCSLQNYNNFFALHVQSHGIGSQLPHCTCRVTALDHSSHTARAESWHSDLFSHCTCRVMALNHSSHTARAESRHWITAPTLHVQSHGTESQFSHCTCRVTALDHSSHTARAESWHTALHHVIHFKHSENSTPNTTSFFG